MGQAVSFPTNNPLGLIFQDWEKFRLLGLKTKKLVRLCNHVYPQCELESQEKWPLNGSLSYDTILQLDLYCRRKSKWSELPYVQIFMALHLGNRTQKEVKACVTWRDKSNCLSPYISRQNAAGILNRF